MGSDYYNINNNNILNFLYVGIEVAWLLFDQL